MAASSCAPLLTPPLPTTFAFPIALHSQAPSPQHPSSPAEKRLAYIALRRQQKEIEEIQRLHKAGVKIPGMPDLKPGEKLNLPKPKMK